VISKKNSFIDFLDELGLFVWEKPIFTKKKNSVALPWFHGCPNENFVRPIFERCLQVRELFFWITEGIGLTEVSFHFWLEKQIPSGRVLAPFSLSHEILPILMFLGLIWCKILCWTQKKYTLWGLKSNKKPLEPKSGIF
jgi:hypothetical protein